jgi:hypothetical protein
MIAPTCVYLSLFFLYLASLAVVDTLFLFTVGVVWLSMINVPFYNTVGPCQLVVYCRHVCHFLSVWYVLGFTFERFVIVRFPLRKDWLCRPRRARQVVATLTCAALALYIFTTFTNGVLFAGDDEDDHRGIDNVVLLPPLCIELPR